MKDSTRGTAVRTRGRSGGVVVPRAVTEWEALDPYDFRLAVWLSTHEEHFGERISQREMARRLGMSQERIQKSLLVLECLGLVEVERHGERSASEVTFVHGAWDEHLLAGRSPSARHTSSSCSPDEHKENTGANTESSTRERVGRLFEQFWAVYPKKTEKVRALSVFERVVMKAPKGQRTAKAREIIDGAKRYSDACRGKDKQYVKGPAGWLRDGRWEDEIAPPGSIEEDQARLIAEYNSVKYV